MHGQKGSEEGQRKLSTSTTSTCDLPFTMPVLALAEDSLASTGLAEDVGGKSEAEVVGCSEASEAFSSGPASRTVM